jgi:plastocyanin
MKRTTPLLMLAVIFSLLLAACGGGNGGEQTQPNSQPAATQPPAAEEMEEPEAPAAGGYEGVPVTGGGSITGKITYSGAPVEPETVPVDKDVEVCGDSQQVVKVKTDGSGGLADAVVRITNIQSGKPLESLGSEFVIDQVDCVYVPAALIVPVGKEVTIKNSDAILHNVHTTPFDNPPLNVAQPATEPEIKSPAFTIPEIIEVGCDVHKWMHASIVVVDNPYAVVTSADGSFTLTDVPPGEYTVEVWHPELGTQTATVTVAEGQEATVDVDYQ